MKTMLRRAAQSPAFISLFYYFLAKGKLARLTEAPEDGHVI
jgi:hypothetical protein